MPKYRCLCEVGFGGFNCQTEVCKYMGVLLLGVDFELIKYNFGIGSYFKEYSRSAINFEIQAER